MHMFPDYVVQNGQHVSLGTGMRIAWQEGTFMQAGKNGAMLELPVRALLHRIADLNATRPCKQNNEIVQHLNAVLGLLDERTRERNARGVLGTAAR
jgi:hypothetical protein